MTTCCGSIGKLELVIININILVLTSKYHIMSDGITSYPLNASSFLGLHIVYSNQTGGYYSIFISLQ